MIRCIGFDPIAKACSSPSARSKQCRRCGTKVHINKDCRANPNCFLCKGEETIGTLEAAAGAGNSGEPTTQIANEAVRNQSQPLPSGAGHTLANRPREKHRCAKDQTWQVALWACEEEAFPEIMEHLEENFIREKVKGVRIYSSYSPSTAKLAEYEQMLSTLIFDARGLWPIIIVSDFNA